MTTKLQLRERLILGQAVVTPSAIHPADAEKLRLLVESARTAYIINHIRHHDRGQQVVFVDRNEGDKHGDRDCEHL